ncbi:ATP-binding protein [Nonomuraea sp. NPDC026600]|uniref:ATP-binding protein n=1 Tax=Nonomuraea sp. NPDC026600 TaxID=3155363 RepID=UPI0033E9D1DE
MTTNAVRYGGGGGRLSLWQASDRLHCQVTDSGPGLPWPDKRSHRPVPPGSGRGPWLARQWVNHLTIESDANATTVTLETAAPQPDHPRARSFSDVWWGLVKICLSQTASGPLSGRWAPSHRARGPTSSNWTTSCR